jgi:hypothetical protein
MASSAYMLGRKKYSRPQAILWSNNPGTLSNGLYIPTGHEIGQNPTGENNALMLDQFLILSDHNRSEIKMSPQRIEKRERMINGHMRSYHIADKMNFDWQWSALPSRAFSANPNFNGTTGKSLMTGKSGLPSAIDSQYTVDGGAGAAELLDWYENHKGSFWMFLAYDKYTNFPADDNSSEYGHLNQYNEIVEVYFSKFDYSVSARGQNTFDLWNVSVTLEEV